MSMPTLATSSNNAEMILRLERLSRQTSLVALETSLEAAESGLRHGDLVHSISVARNVTQHMMRATVEMQQAAKMMP